MYKERPMPFQKGSDDTLKYWASSGGVISSSYFTKDVCLSMYEQGKKNAATFLVDPGYLGRESFSSTERKKPLYNACEHHKLAAVNLPYMAAHSAYGYPSYLCYYEHYYRHPIIGIDRSIVVPEFSVPDSVRSRAWWSMQPRFEGEISLLNALFELKDFKDISKNLLRPVELLDKFSNYLRRHKRSLRDLDLSKPAAQIHLLNAFAIKPLINDFRDIASMIGTLASEAQFLFERAGLNTQKSHYSEFIARDPSKLVRQNYNSRWFAYGENVESAYTATMSYTYGYDARNALNAFAHYWGLTGSAEAFWNAIPFSFLVDYFFQIGKAIHVMSADPNVHLQLHQYCESVNTSVTRGYHMMPSNSDCTLIAVLNGKYLGTVDRPYLISGTSGTVYSRRLADPYKGPALPKLKLPSSSQGLNMLALGRCFL